MHRVVRGSELTQVRVAVRLSLEGINASLRLSSVGRQTGKPRKVSLTQSPSLLWGRFSYFYEPHFNVLGPRWGAFVITIRAVPYSWTNHITTMVTSVSITVLRH